MKFVFNIAVTILITACGNLNYRICTCEISNLENGTIKFTSDTLEIMDKEKAIIACSNHSTSDDPSESITCKIK